MTELPADPLDCVDAVVATWPAQPVEAQEVSTLLRRLSEAPLHAPAFSGGVRIGASILLMHEGSIVGAVDPRSRSVGERVVESLPAAAPAELHPVPDSLSPRAVPLLTQLLDDGRPLHRNLDSAFVNLPALAQELAGQGFDGLIRIRRDTARAHILFDRGQPVLQLFSTGWRESAQDRHWESWISDLKVRADVEAFEPRIVYASYRLRLAEHVLEIAPQTGSSSAATRTSSGLRRLLGTRSTATLPGLRLDIRGQDRPAATDAQGDPIFSFLRWMASALPTYFSERQRTARWKYLAEWMPLVRKAILHHHLPRAGTRDSDFFDLVTFDDNDKVLHIAHRVAHGSIDALNDLVSRVITAKTARIKTGDVGGVCLVAPDFDPDVLASYASGKDPTGSWEMALTETMTGYEGFVRLGPRRGFHLLLVRETAEGFEPVLPEMAAVGV